MKKISIILLYISIVVYSTSAQVIPKTPFQRLTSINQSTDLQKKINLQSITADLNSNITLDKSGDLNLNLPLVTIVSRTLNIPLTANYHSGIKVDQKSSEIGLGWSINFGSIVRDYGVFEPDYSSLIPEGSMINTSTNPPFTPGVLSVTYNSVYPYSMNIYKTLVLPGNVGKDLIYSGFQNANQQTPDNYSAILPGKTSTQFWNNASYPSTVPSFHFNEQVPFNIEASRKTFTIEQEVSNINEINLGSQASQMAANSPGVYPLQGYSGSWANAICIPPYANDRYQAQIVHNFEMIGSAPPFPQYILPPGSPTPEKVCYEDYDKFTITTEDGYKYFYTKPLREQKYLFTDDPYWSTLNYINYADVNSYLPQVSSLGEFWKTDYIKEWLLTSIESPDYYDRTGDGYSPDDEGDYVSYIYETASNIRTDVYNYSAHFDNYREWLNFSETDAPSSLIREHAYISKILTPLKEYDFTSSFKFDIDHDYFQEPENRLTGLMTPFWADITNQPEISKINYPCELKKYDKIQTVNLVSGNIESTLLFHYAQNGSPELLCKSDYSIRNGNNEEKSESNQTISRVHSWGIENYKKLDPKNIRGKLTLTGIEIFPEGDLTSDFKMSYGFEYANNPSFGPIHKRQILYMRNFPSIRESFSQGERYQDWQGLIYNQFDPDQFRTENFDWEYLPYTAKMPQVPASNDITNFGHIYEDELGYYFDPNDIQNKGRDAWSLTKIKLPEGGNVEFQYELDNFDYSNDRNNWNLKDDELPLISHYNDIANHRAGQQNIEESVYHQDYLIGLGIGLYKSKCRSFEMKLNSNSGGIRLKQKIVNSCFNSPVVTTYGYGTGHFQSVPSSYWSNYLKAFSSFISDERLRNQHELGNYSGVVNSPGVFLWNDQGAMEDIYGGFSTSFIDFDYFMNEIPVPVRVDNSMGDSHYYEYIDAISASGAKQRSIYQCPSNNGVDYKKQNWVLLRGYANLLNDRKSTAILEDYKQEKEPELVSVENYDNAENLISKTQTIYNFVSTSEISLNLQTKGLGDLVLPAQYNSYAINRETSNGTFVRYDLTFGHNGLSYGAFQIDGQNTQLKQSIWKRVSSKIETTDNVSTQTYFGYTTGPSMAVNATATVSSDGKINVKNTKYLSDFTLPGGQSFFDDEIDSWNNMLARHQLNVVLEETNLCDGKCIGGKYYKYNSFPNGELPLYKVSKIFDLKLDRPVTDFVPISIPQSGNIFTTIDSRYAVQKDFQQYDVYGNLITEKVDNAVYASNVYNNLGRNLTASFSNTTRRFCDPRSICSSKTESFCGFESKEINGNKIVEDGWDIDMLKVDNTRSHTGYSSFRVPEAISSSQFSYSANQEVVPFQDFQSDKFKLSAWVMTPPSFQGGTAEIVAQIGYANSGSGSFPLTTSDGYKSQGFGNTNGIWQQVELVVDLGAIRANNSVPFGELLKLNLYCVNYNTNEALWIDDIKFEPVDANAATYTYDNIYNLVSSQSDDRGNIIYYEYTKFGKVKTIRDLNRNILKDFTYNLMEPCN